MQPLPSRVRIRGPCFYNSLQSGRWLANCNPVGILGCRICVFSAEVYGYLRQTCSDPHNPRLTGSLTSFDFSLTSTHYTYSTQLSTHPLQKSHPFLAFRNATLSCRRSYFSLSKQRRNDAPWYEYPRETTLTVRKRERICWKRHSKTYMDSITLLIFCRQRHR